MAKTYVGYRPRRAAAGSGHRGSPYSVTPQSGQTPVTLPGSLVRDSGAGVDFSLLRPDHPLFQSPDSGVGLIDKTVGRYPGMDPHTAVQAMAAREHPLSRYDINPPREWERRTDWDHPNYPWDPMEARTASMRDVEGNNISLSLGRGEGVTGAEWEGIENPGGVHTWTPAEFYVKNPGLSPHLYDAYDDWYFTFHLPKVQGDPISLGELGVSDAPYEQATQYLSYMDQKYAAQQVDPSMAEGENDFFGLLEDTLAPIGERLNALEQGGGNDFSDLLLSLLMGDQGEEEPSYYFGMV